MRGPKLRERVPRGPGRERQSADAAFPPDALRENDLAYYFVCFFRENLQGSRGPGCRCWSGCLFQGQENPSRYCYFTVLLGAEQIGVDRDERSMIRLHR